MPAGLDDAAPVPPSDGWWVRHDTESFGPYTEAQMRSFVLEGRVVAETPVRHGEAPDWQPASRHARFGPIFAELAAAGPPPPEQTREEAPDLSGAPGGASAAGVGPVGVPASLAGAGGLPPGETATMAHIVYGLYVLSPFTGGLSGIIGVIIAHMKRRDVRGTWLATHYQWQIRTFWIAVAVAIVASILSHFFIGVLVFAALGIWYVWRIVKGWVRLGSNRAVDDPTGWI